MRDDRNEARNHEIEQGLVEPRRQDVMWRFDEHVAAIAQRQDLARSQTRDEPWCDVNVGAGRETERESCSVELGLECGHRGADAWSGVVVEARQDVRRARHRAHALRDERLGHRERSGQIRRSIVDAGKNVAMQIDHGATQTKVDGRDSTVWEQCYPILFAI